ncbi:MAG: hypothetical protein REI78_15385 [Pedobacter sp.]|nr:hypothetical protein [Pedobacter sp.]MDQ8054414.1 hypothetical protein [Pedobacter sp.]
MSLHPISVTLDNITYRFEVGEYPHHDEMRCKFSVYYQGKLMATFAPDRNHILHLCQNYGNMKEPILHLVADQLEALHHYGFFEQQ